MQEYWLISEIQYTKALRAKETFLSALSIIKPTLSNNFNFGLINNQTNVNEISKTDIVQSDCSIAGP